MYETRRPISIGWWRKGSGVVEEVGEGGGGGWWEKDREGSHWGLRGPLEGTCRLMGKGM